MVFGALSLWSGSVPTFLEDAVYPTTYLDAEGKALNGANRYTLHFDKGLAPPVNAFWSVTMYDAQSFFVDNAINRYAIGSWMPLERNGAPAPDAGPIRLRSITRCAGRCASNSVHPSAAGPN